MSYGSCTLGEDFHLFLFPKCIIKGMSSMAAPTPIPLRCLCHWCFDTARNLQEILVWLCCNLMRHRNYLSLVGDETCSIQLPVWRVLPKWQKNEFYSKMYRVWIYSSHWKHSAACLVAHWGPVAPCELGAWGRLDFALERTPRPPLLHHCYLTHCAPTTCTQMWAVHDDG